MENNIQKTILEKIQKGELQMTSRKYFVLKWLTLALTSLFFLMLGVYIFAYVTFLFFDNGLMVIPLEAEDGVLKFIIEIPWTLVFLGLISVFLFSITSKTFYKIYRKPFLTFFFSILMIIMISHIILLETGTMKQLKEQAYTAGIKLAPSKLLQFRDSQTQNLYVGYVLSTSTNSITIINRTGIKQELFLENIENSELLNKITAISLGQKINAYAVWDNEKINIKTLEIVQ